MNPDIQRRRTRAKTNSFIVLAISVLILFFGTFALLYKPLSQQRENTPIGATERFIGFVELKQFSAAHNLMTPTFQNTPGWHGILYQLYTSIDPSEAGYQLMGQKGDLAQVQFSNETGGYLYLKDINGKWLVASPNELPGASSAGTGVPPTTSSTGP